MNEKDEKIFEAWVALIRSHQMLTDAVENDLKQAGLPPLSWYDVLLEINREPDCRLRLQDIGSRILLAKNNVTRLVDRLEKEKLVTRKKCKSDGRGVYAYIEPEGKALLKKMWPIYRQSVLTHFKAGLSDKDIGNLCAILQILRSSAPSGTEKSELVHGTERNIKNVN